MPSIYSQREDEFDRNVIFDKMDRFQSLLEEEQEKPDGERDRQREFNLMYAQFMQGLRLSTGMRW